MSESIEPIDDKLNIEDIDQPLYKYCLFYKFDISGHNVTQKQVIIQKFKSYISSIYIILFAIHTAICFIINKNGRIPLYYFDFIQYMGGITKFFYISAIIVCIMTVRIVYILNNSHNNHYDWLKIIEVLKGLNSLNRSKFMTNIL